MEKHYEYTEYQHATPFVLNGPTTVKTIPISFVADVFLKLFSLFHECVCIHCFDCSLVSTFINETQNSSPVTHTMWLWNSSPSSWYCSKNVKFKAEAILCILWAPMSIFGTHLAQNLWYPSLTVIILYTTVREICGNSHESSEIVKRRPSPILNKIIGHYRQPTTSLLIMNICLPIFEHSTPLSYSQPHIIHSCF
jgi:hypothetical protein